MITKRITLPDGTLIEFFANNTEEMALMLPEYAEKRQAKQQQLKEAQYRRKKARKKCLKSQKQARRRARG